MSFTYNHIVMPKNLNNSLISMAVLSTKFCFRTSQKMLLTFWQGHGSPQALTVSHQQIGHTQMFIYLSD